jgi:Ca-activated chloride channel family protein
LSRDGEDNSSRRRLQQSIEAAEAAGITLYSLNTAEDFDLHTDANVVLRVLADRTGGESTYPRNRGEIDRFFDRLGQAIRSRYLIAYKPASFVPDGSYRTLKVTTRERWQTAASARTERLLRPAGAGTVMPRNCRCERQK